MPLQRPSRRVSLTAALAALLAGALACGDAPTQPEREAARTEKPGSVTETPPPPATTPPTTTESGPAGSMSMSYSAPAASDAHDDRLTSEIAVKAFGPDGRPAQGILVTFTMSEGSGSVSPAQAETDESGVARTTLTLPYDEENSVLAMKANSTSRTMTTIAAYRSHEGGISAPKPFLDGKAGTALAEPVAVLVRDREGQPLANREVRFAVDMGGGSLSTPTATTDAAGVARVSWTLGVQMSVNRLKATGDKLVPTYVHAIGRR